MKIVYIDVAARTTKALLLEIVFLRQEEILGLSWSILKMVNPLIVLFNISDGYFDFDAVLVILITG